MATRPNQLGGAAGIKAGGFTAFPVLTTELAYDDNVRATRVGKQSDGFVTVRPSVSLRSDWAVHQLDINASGEVRKYFSISRENSEQVQLDASGRLDIARDLYATGNAAVARRIENRGSIGDILLTGEPVVYRELSAGGDITKTLGPVLLRVGGAISDYHYNDVKLDTGPVDLSFRNYRTRIARARVGYRVGPGVRAFVAGAINDAKYPRDSRNSGRNSDGWEITGGASFGLTPLLYGEVAAGYLEQNFADPIYPKISGLSYRASVNWNPTPLVGVTVNAGRTVQRGPLQAVAGVSVNQARVSADYELLRQLILSAGVGYSRASYRGLDRVENRWSANLSARYRMNDHVKVLVGYDFQRLRSSQVGAREYDDSAVRVGIVLEA